MKKKIHFCYQSYDCYVSFDLWIQLILQSSLLVIIRLLRLCKRIMMHLKKYIPILMCIILFELFVIPIGLYLGKYETWIDGFWDLRLFLLTSILISVVVGISSNEMKRHKELLEQYNTYKSFECSSQNFIISLCNVADYDIKQDLFISENNFDIFYTQLLEKIEDSLPKINNKIVKDEYLLYSTEELPRIVAIKIYFDQYYRALDNVNQSLLAHEYIGNIRHALEQINDIFNELKAECLLIDEQKEYYTDLQLLKFIDCISRVIYPAIADIRNPWRWDMKINNKMRSIINKEI